MRGLFLARLRCWRRTIVRRSGEPGRGRGIRFHIEAYAEDLVRQGMAEARHKARAQFGNAEVQSEKYREAVGLRCRTKCGAIGDTAARTQEESGLGAVRGSSDGGTAGVLPFSWGPPRPIRARCYGRNGCACRSAAAMLDRCLRGGADARNAVKLRDNAAR